MVMGNHIKYSTSPQVRALKKGNFWIGVKNDGKGPTATTGYYTASAPPTNGYTIYLNKETEGPSIYKTTDDTQLISVTNKISGQSFTTPAQCLTWFTTQTDKICVNRTYEDIVTDGLVLNLDAGFTPSYPTSGTSWYSLGTSGGTSILYNSIGYSPFTGGTLLFDGTDDIVGFPSSFDFVNSEFSTEFWGSITGPLDSGNRRTIFGNDADGAYEFSNQNVLLFRGIYDDTFQFINFPTDYQVPTGQTFHHVFQKLPGNVYRQFFNGVLTNTLTPPYTFGEGGTLTSTTSVIHKFKGLGDFYGFRLWKGGFNVARIYNRALSTNEVLQNYNAQKGRFGS